MKKLFGYLLSPIYYLFFALTLFIFWPLQWLSFNLFGKQAHKRMVDALSFCLYYELLLLGNNIKVTYQTTLPTGKVLIFAANHQSNFDAMALSWHLRKYAPKFVAKIELARGIPSVSYNLKHSGSALINRKDNAQALAAIANLGKLIQKQSSSVIIFPEGTRSKTGKMKRFALGGIGTLLEQVPQARIVPVCIKNTGKLNRWGAFPLSPFEKLRWVILPAIDPAGKTPSEMIALAENAVRLELEKPA